MSTNEGDSSAREQRANEAIAAYLEAVDAGEAPDPKEFVAQHGDVAAELEAFFVNRAQFERLAEPLKPAAVEATLPMPDDQANRKSTPALGPGSKLRYFGDYELLEEIARGGMGVVYKARQTTLKRIVALKMILSGQLAGEEDVKRFYAEAEAAAKLDHPGIVPIFEIGQHDGQHYFSMALVEGESLARKVAEKPLPPREAAGLIRKVAEAVAYAHVEGVVHRDLKPANVLLDKDGEPRVTDFGLAKRISAESLTTEAEDSAGLTATGQILGTPSYMPPEQAAGKTDQIGPLADVYSLGAMLYCLLTGRPPFQAASPLDTLLQVLQKDPVAPRQLDPKVPRDLETICLKCLEKDPHRRYMSVRELAEDLRRWLGDEPIRARRIGLVGRAVRWVRRHRRVTATSAVAALAAAVLVMGTIWGVQFYRQSQLGYLELSTSGPQMVAEVLDENDNQVVPSFPVPTPEPVALPAGSSYRIRLSASGLLSETWPLEVERGKTRSQSVNFRPRWLWSPREVNTDEGHQEIELADLDGRCDLIVVSHRVPGPQGDTFFRRLRRLDGATGKAIWSLDFSNETLPAGHDLRTWSTLLTWSGVGFPGYLVDPPPDLNGDGTRDLVWASRTSPSLVAVSGTDGKLLWWFRGRPVLPEEAGAGQWRSYSREPRTVVGQAGIADVDGDGTSDFIACFLSPNEEFQPESGKAIHTDRQSWIEAVSGSTGTSLWRSPLPTKFQYMEVSSEVYEKFHTACRLQVVQIDGQSTVVTVAENLLMGLDLKSGKPAWPPRDLGFIPWRPPMYADLDRDGNSDALFIRRLEGADLALVAVSLRGGQTLWDRPFRPDYHLSDDRRQQGGWYHVGDLNNDGSVEVVIATGDFADRSPSGVWADDRWCGVEVLDGSTGQTRWQRRLCQTGRYTPPSVDRLISGPDLDGDGHLEVFAACSGKVVALSGQDGRPLWRCPVPGMSGPLQWWQPGPDGRPLLVVPMANARGGQHVTYFLSASTGRLVHILPEVYDPKVADFDGDGILDLFYTVSPQGAARMLVIRGAPPEPWKRLGTWLPVGDVDGDGLSDFMKKDELTAASGRDGRLLWQQRDSLERDNQMPPLAPPLPHGDLDGDGAPDVIALVRGHRTDDGRGRLPFATVAAYSGKDGQRIWQADDFKMGSGGGGTSSASGWHSNYPMLDWADLDRDGRAEIVVAHHKQIDRYRGDESRELWVSVFSGRDGKLLFEVPTMENGFGASPDPYGRRFDDLNGDDIGDLVVWISKDNEKKPHAVRAFSGSDGSTLWTSSAIDPDYALWPRPAVGDLDGDGHAEVLVSHSRYEENRGHQCEMVVLNGHDGKPKWSHSWQGNPNLLPPLLVDFDGNGRRSVCVGLHDNSTNDQMLIFDADGKERERWPLDVRVSSIFQMWQHGDLDGDGREELLFVREGKLRASRGVKDEFLWSWDLPDQNARILELSRPNPAPRSDKGQPATLVVWAGSSVYGLSGSDGQVIWRCDGSVSPQFGASNPPTATLLAGSDPTGPPRVVFQGPSYSNDWSTICRQAWPVSSDGKYQPATAAPRHYDPLPEIERPARPLPWTRFYGEWDETLSLVNIVLPALSFMVVVLPLLLICRAIRRRSWRLGLWSTLYTAVSGIPYALYATTMDRPTDLDGVPVGMHAAVGLPGAVFFTLAVFLLVRCRWRLLGWLLVGSVAMSVVAAAGDILSHSTDSSVPYSWSGWYWIWFTGTYYTGIVILLGTPVVMFPLLILRHIRRGKQRGQATFLDK